MNLNSKHRWISIQAGPWLFVDEVYFRRTFKFYWRPKQILWYERYVIKFWEIQIFWCIFLLEKQLYVIARLLCDKNILDGHGGRVIRSLWLSIQRYVNYLFFSTIKSNQCSSEVFVRQLMMLFVAWLSSFHSGYDWRFWRRKKQFTLFIHAERIRSEATIHSWRRICHEECWNRRENCEGAHCLLDV